MFWIQHQWPPPGPSLFLCHLPCPVSAKRIPLPLPPSSSQLIVCTNAFFPHQQTATYPNQNLLSPPLLLFPNPSSPPFLSSLPGCWVLPVTRIWSCLPLAGVPYHPTCLWAAYLSLHTCSPLTPLDHPPGSGPSSTFLPPSLEYPGLKSWLFYLLMVRPGISSLASVYTSVKWQALLYGSCENYTKWVHGTQN